MGISNATSGGSDAQITYLVNQGVIPPLCKFLNFEVIGMRKKILLVALEGIENILAVGQRMGGHENPFARYVEECGGVDYLEQLQSNQSVPDEIYDKAASIIKEYFGGEEADQPNIFINNNNNNNNQNQQNNMQNMQNP